YFEEHEGVGTYSTYSGYANSEDNTYESRLIEIQFDAISREIHVARFTTRKLSSERPKHDELTPALLFLDAIEPKAAEQFKRNFQTVFWYQENGPDSSRYSDSTKDLFVSVDHNLDFVAKKQEKISDAYIQVQVSNKGNSYHHDQKKIDAANKERKEKIENAFNAYDGSHI